jgi:NADPH:quinone reductase-like Zn-dependent oxidoreductase
MKAVYIDEYGTSEILKYGDRPDPEIAPGEVLIKVGASALNRLDIGLRSGRSYNGALPRIMGCDISGEVIQISNEAKTQLKIGDRVIIDNRVKCGECENCVQGSDRYCISQKRFGVDLDGGHAEYINVPAMNAYTIPDSMPFTEAAALPLAAHTAWHCLITQGQIQPWDDVLIHAASSGVASMAIQIAKMIGARVITTAGIDWKIKRAKELGADDVINYRETASISEEVKSLTHGKGVDLVFDVVGADVWEESLLSLKSGGRLVITGVTSGARTDMNLSILQGKPLHLMGSGSRSRKSFAEMMKVINQGSIRGIVSEVFPLANVAEAHRTMEDRNFFGKLVIEN